MLIHADVSGLEVVCAAYLSRDPVLIQEIWDNKNKPETADLHKNNQLSFSLPDRTTAKRFTFKMLYGGTDYGFSVDNKFNHVSKSRRFWAEVIEKFYGKYKGLADWHETLVSQVLDTGTLVMPTGREYCYPRADVAARLWFWRPKILNYPVQGLGADLVAIGRVTMWKRLRKQGIPHLFVSTVHDSVDIDCESCYNSSIAETIKQSVEDIPINFARLFGRPFDLPISCEIGFGQSLGELTKYESNNSIKSN